MLALAVGATSAVAHAAGAPQAAAVFAGRFVVAATSAAVLAALAYSLWARQRLTPTG
jgi:hypothetical protein